MMDLIKRRSSYRKTLFDFEKEVYFLEIKLKLNNFKKKIHIIETYVCTKINHGTTIISCPNFLTYTYYTFYVNKSY